MGKQAIGQSLRARRRQLGLTQQELADMAGISINTLYQLERGQSNATLQVLEKVCEVLGLECQLIVKSTPDPSHDA